MARILLYYGGFFITCALAFEIKAVYEIKAVSEMKAVFEKKGGAKSV